MTLSLRLRHVDLTLECKHCGWPLIKNGSWFITASRFRCVGCKREVRIRRQGGGLNWRPLCRSGWARMIRAESYSDAIIRVAKPGRRSR